MSKVTKLILAYAVPQGILVVLWLGLIMVKINGFMIWQQAVIPVTTTYIVWSILSVLVIIESIQIIRINKSSLFITFCVLFSTSLFATSIMQFTRNSEIYYYEEDGYTIMIEDNNNFIFGKMSFYYQRSDMIAEEFTSCSRFVGVGCDFHIDDGYLVFEFFDRGEVETTWYKIPE